jgi:hypothetical protein
MRITLNPTFDIESGELLHHDGQFEVAEIPILFDRSAQSEAGQNVKTDRSLAGQAGTEAGQIGASFIPGLERQAQNPTGFTPLEKGRQLTAGAEAIGGVNAGLTGEANLASARTRTAGGFAPALDEAARIKSRQLSTNALGVENQDAILRQKKQQEANQQLGQLYGMDRSNQLRAMGLSDEAINSQVNAGKSGWQQNAMGWINAIKPSGSGGGGGGGGGDG